MPTFRVQIEAAVAVDAEVLITADTEEEAIGAAWSAASGIAPEHVIQDALAALPRGTLGGHVVITDVRVMNDAP